MPFHLVSFVLMFFSCANHSNNSCLNHGICAEDQCICSSACYLGDHCEIWFNAIDLSFASAILEDIPSTRGIYIAVITILVLLGLINNCSAFLTFIRESIRLTACGIYLIVFCICTIVLMILLQITVITIAEYDSPLFRRWSCYASPYISLTMGYMTIWMSVSIAIERVLIECFNMNFYGSRLHAVVVSCGFFIYSAITNLPAIFAREYNYNPGGQQRCIYNYLDNPKWKKFDTVSSYIHIIIPCLVHVICAICVLITIVRRKIIIQQHNLPQKNLYRTWFRQLYYHRDFFVPTLFIFIGLSPNAIHSHLIVQCVPYSSLIHLRLHIVFIFLMYTPSVFVYLLYIYPSHAYQKEYRQTFFYRIFCRCCHQTERRSNKMLTKRLPKISSIVEETGL